MCKSITDLYFYLGTDSQYYPIIMTSSNDYANPSYDKDDEDETIAGNLSDTLSTQNKKLPKSIQNGASTKSAVIAPNDTNFDVAGNQITLKNPDIACICGKNDSSIDNGSNVKNNTEHNIPEVNIPDGGFGWIVCFAAMIINGTVFGIINSFGILFVPLVDKYSKIDSSIAFKTCKYIKT